MQEYTVDTGTDPEPIQQVDVRKIVAEQIGQLMLSNIELTAAIDALQKRVKRLEKSSA